MSQMNDIAGQIAAFEGIVGVYVQALDQTQAWYTHHAQRVFPAASTIKLPILMVALQQVQAGKLSLTERYTLRHEDQVSGSGVLHELGEGLNVTLQDLLTLMIIVSDNTATNMLIDLVGQDDVNTWLHHQGLQQTHLVGKLQLTPEKRNEAQKAGKRNTTSARDMAVLLHGLHHGRWLNPEYSALALRILERQQYKDIIGRAMPRDVSGDYPFLVASKSGEIVGTRNDVALVCAAKPYVVCILSEGIADAREHPENTGIVQLTALARVLHSTLQKYATDI